MTVKLYRCGNELKFLMNQPEVLTYMSDTPDTDKTIFQHGALRKVSMLFHYYN